MRYAILFIIAAVLFSACQRAEPANTNMASTAKRYELKGKIVSVNKSGKTATIEHEAIAGLMAADTMEFPIREDWVWDELKPGVEVRAELVVDNTAKDPFWLEKVGIIAAANSNQAEPPIDPNMAQIGRNIPDFSLTNQDGKRISLKDFRGKTWAITFIYARCPLPNYCIRMSTNFSDAAKAIKDDAELNGKAALLSISFDPQNDTPAKLRSYGLGYMGQGATSLGAWQLAVGSDPEVRKIADFYGLRYEVDENDKTQINHNLRTLVIGPNGKVTKVFAGNDWTAEQLLSELRKAAGS